MAAKPATKISSEKRTSVRVKCSCTSPFQDGEYGPNIRVATVGGKTGSNEYRCTVCGKTHSSTVL